MTVHPIPPLFDKNSEILILGSFPSVKSREAMFFYGHPQNRFWKVVSAVFERKTPENVKEKKEMMLAEHVALWDVIASCDITGSSDSSIKNVCVNDLSVIIDNSRVRKIFVNGQTAMKYYNRYIRKTTGIEATCLPSTSPANAAWSFEKLTEAWKVIRIRADQD